MISVADALDALFALVDPLPTEWVPLRAANGRVLSQDVSATRDQPPFAASAMDGYAVSGASVTIGACYKVIGEAAAGHKWSGAVAAGEAVRIFTGAPLPDSTDHVVIQENITRNGDVITITEGPNDAPYVRPAGADFTADTVMKAPRLLTSTDVALLAAMNVATVPVTRRPSVAIIPTGDELVQPGEIPNEDQIIASNSYGLAALLENAGCDVWLQPIARDNLPALALAFDMAADADLVVTIGGASVGDHDLVALAATEAGLERSFYKVAMRPGKPLMAGRLKSARLIGLPGNPVSAMVCGHVFLLPVVRKMLGLGQSPTLTTSAQLTHDIGPNGPREHYMRAHTSSEGLTIFPRQDSALLSVLADANCLAIRPPNDSARKAGETLKIIPLA